MTYGFWIWLHQIKISSPPDPTDSNLYSSRPNWNGFEVIISTASYTTFLINLFLWSKLLVVPFFTLINNNITAVIQEDESLEHLFNINLLVYTKLQGILFGLGPLWRRKSQRTSHKYRQDKIYLKQCTGKNCLSAITTCLISSVYTWKFDWL